MYPMVAATMLMRQQSSSPAVRLLALFIDGPRRDKITYESSLEKRRWFQNFLSPRDLRGKPLLSITVINQAN